MATGTSTSSGQSAATDSTSALFGNTEFVKFFTDSSSKIYSDSWSRVLGFAADRLQDQAAYLKQLSQCTSPADALKLNASFAQQSASRFFDDGLKLFDRLRSGTTENAPAK